MTSSAQIHIPVMLPEVLAALDLKAGDTVVDATFGAGGYSRAFLEAVPDCRVIALDRDPAAIARGQILREEFGDRLTLIKTRFSQMSSVLPENQPIQGIVFDLGISSPQIDEAARGFSFRFEGPLDMRMEEDGPSAAEVVNTLAEEDLASIFFDLGEERHSRRIARGIIASRTEKPITTTLALADIIRSNVPRSADGIDPATRSFQALRIYVNNELGELEQGLAEAERILAPNGRLVTVSFHSLEDRIVKQFLRARTGTTPSGSRHLPPLAANDDAPSFTLPRASDQPIAPSDAECRSNSRARSAKLRYAHRTAAPAWGRAERLSFSHLSALSNFPHVRGRS